MQKSIIFLINFFFFFFFLYLWKYDKKYYI